MTTVTYDWRVIAQDEDSMHVAYVREGFTTICVDMELPVAPETCEDVVKRHAPAAQAWEGNPFFTVPETMPGGAMGQFTVEGQFTLASLKPAKKSLSAQAETITPEFTGIRTMRAIP